tara:strand:+ start:187 stop:1302 length:1116 start_codon:yes stop_codon:yes gene_type:complete
MSNSSTYVSQCPVAAFSQRVNSTAIEQWVDEQWNGGTFGGEDVGPIVIGATLLVCSLIFLFAGDRLVRPVLFLTGFAAALVPSFAAIDAILSAIPASVLSPSADCALLIVLPLLFAVGAGMLNVCFLSLAFFTLGGVSGAAFGYYLYVLVLHTIPSPVIVDGYTVVFCLAVVISALVGALAMLKAKHTLLMCATAVAGAIGAVVGLDMLVLGRIDRRFLYLLDARTASEHIGSPFVFGPIICARRSRSPPVPSPIARLAKRLSHLSPSACPLPRSRGAARHRRLPPPAQAEGQEAPACHGPAAHHGLRTRASMRASAVPFETSPWWVKPLEKEQGSLHVHVVSVFKRFKQSSLKTLKNGNDALKRRAFQIA